MNSPRKSVPHYSRRSRPADIGLLKRELARKNATILNMRREKKRKRIKNQRRKLGIALLLLTAEVEQATLNGEI